MPSLRKRVSSYFRQLSFHNEPRDKKHNLNENSFVTKYLQGQVHLREGPPIIYGKNPTDLPNYELDLYEIGYNSIVGCYTGPNGGLTTVKRTEKHLSVTDPDIDFIDTALDCSDEIEGCENFASTGRDTEAIDNNLPSEWNIKSDHVYGISDSLYDHNLITKHKNGDPIADCFGIIARNDSAILAVADGVNWGEKASIAAKSAIHGCLHYLNKTIFNDTKLFENLTRNDTGDNNTNNTTTNNLNLESHTKINNTKDIFVCLLRAFNCAHDLILENNGMLTTLTVAVVLPTKQQYNNNSSISQEKSYVCCVCNVGDTLAYIYSQKYGLRELTKGSHDINCNRDMRDALGALGPVDGINPELSNLTLSITLVQKDDILLVASDGLTDNFDPNVCKFTVNSTTNTPVTTTSNSNHSKRTSNLAGKTEQKASRVDSLHKKPPLKPPRRSHLKNSNVDPNLPASSFQGISTSKGLMTSTTSSAATAPKSSETVPLSNHTDNDDDKTKRLQEFDNPLVAQFMKDNSVDDQSKSTIKSSTVVVMENKASSLRRQLSSHNKPSTSNDTSQHQRHNKRMYGLQQQNKSASSIHQHQQHHQPQSNSGYKFLRSKTTIDMRSTNNYNKLILRNEDGLPFVTPIQRYEIQLLLIEDILLNGISGKELPCKLAKKLCENLVNFTFSITSAKRHTLEEQELYYENRNGVLVELSANEKKMRRKKGLERVQNLPGKLDHVTVVAWNIASSNVSN